MGWKRGPLPENSWGWGGCVPVGDDTATGFYFADFHGDHVTLMGAGPGGSDLDVPADKVAWYDNGLTLPPVEGVQGRAGGKP